MPFIQQSKISRKKFLESSLKLTGAAITVGIFSSDAKSDERKVGFRLAILSDTHLAAYTQESYRGFYPSANLKTVIGQVNEVDSEALLINGDVARLTGELGDYSAMKQELSSLKNDLPVMMTLGNHDDRDKFNKVFSGSANKLEDVKNKHVLVIEKYGIRIILLDSLLYVNKVAGLLGKAQRDWLADYLSISDNKPTFLFVHHTLNNGDTDLLDADRLYEIILPHNKVKAIFYGHSHMYKVTEHEHLKLINLPAVGYNFIDSEPVGWIEANISPESGSFKLHAIGGNMEQDKKVTEIFW